MVISVNGEGNSIPFANTVSLADGTNPGFETVEASFNVGSAGDIEITGVELVAGARYEVDVDGGGDTYLRIFDATGRELFVNDDETRRENPAESDFNDPYGQIIADYTGFYYFGISSVENNDYDPITGGDRFSGPGGNVAGGSGTLRITQFDSSANLGAQETNNIDLFGTSQDLDDFTDVFEDAFEGASGAFAQRVELQGNANVFGDTDSDFLAFQGVKGDRFYVDVNHVGSGTGGTRFEVFRFDTSEATFDGFGNDEAEGVFTLPFDTNNGFLGFTLSGVDITNPDTGTLSGTNSGFQDFQIIIHKNWDVLGSNGSEVRTATPGDDRWVMRDGDDTVTGAAGDDHISGGDGNDTLNGGNDDDSLFGEAGNDTLRGNAGNDIVIGGLGDDFLDGNANDDIVEGGAGNDNVNGGGGNDILRGGDGDDTMSGQGGNDTLYGDGGNDTMSGAGANDTLFGGTGNDVMSGNRGADTLNGDSGADTLSGNQDNDVLFGGSGADTLRGGSGNDVLSGDENNDTLIGGSGADDFVFDSLTDGIDNIVDFQLNTDDIDLSALLPGGVDATNFQFFINTVPFAGGGSSQLQVDTNGLTGGLNFTTIATVDGITAAQLFDFDNFIV